MIYKTTWQVSFFSMIRFGLTNNNYLAKKNSYILIYVLQHSKVIAWLSTLPQSSAWFTYFLINTSLLRDCYLFSFLYASHWLQLSVKHLKTFISFHHGSKYFCWRARYGPLVTICLPLDKTILWSHLCERDIRVDIITPHLYAFLSTQNGV